jgi:hypothetical protein
MRDVREMPGERGDGIQALGIGDPADAARGNAGEAPAEIVFAAEFAFFGDKQTQESASDVPEADDGEVVGRNERVSLRGDERLMQERFSEQIIDEVAAGCGTTVGSYGGVALGRYSSVLGSAAQAEAYATTGRLKVAARSVQS